MARRANSRTSDRPGRARGGAYADGVSARVGLRPGETLVVVVSPVAQGVLGPLLLTACILGAVAAAAHLWAWPRAHDWELAALGVPTFVVLCGRTLRWQNHRLAITTERIIEVAGVRRRRTTVLEVAAISAIHARQERWDRVLRRGSVVVSAGDATIELRRVRRPEVFVRVVEQVRQPPAPPPPSESAADAPALDAPVPADADLDADLDVDDAPIRWRHLFGDGGRHS